MDRHHGDGTSCGNSRGRYLPDASFLGLYREGFIAMTRNNVGVWRPPPDDEVRRDQDRRSGGPLKRCTLEVHRAYPQRTNVVRDLCSENARIDSCGLIVQSPDRPVNSAADLQAVISQNRVAGGAFRSRTYAASGHMLLRQIKRTFQFRPIDGNYGGDHPVIRTSAGLFQIFYFVIDASLAQPSMSVRHSRWRRSAGRSTPVGFRGNSL